MNDLTPANYFIPVTMLGVDLNHLIKSHDYDLMGEKTEV